MHVYIHCIAIIDLYSMYILIHVPSDFRYHYTKSYIDLVYICPSVSPGGQKIQNHSTLAKKFSISASLAWTLHEAAH